MPDPSKVAQQSWCITCRAPAGLDCGDTSVGRRAAHKAERRRTRDLIRKDPDHA